MDQFGLLTNLIIVTNVIFSYYGFVNTKFFDGYALNVDAVLRRKDYIRILSSGFLHVGWLHLIFNMLTLHFFGDMLETLVEARYFSIIYLCSLLGGSLMALYFQRNNGNYTAVGASGAVSGVIFASIALMPGLSLSLFGPLGPFIPGWLFGLLYTLYTIYSIRKQEDNIGHEAHLGGALIGILAAILFSPRCLIDNAVPLLAVLIPSLAFFYIVVKKPALLLTQDEVIQRKYNYTLDDHFNAEKVDKQEEIDRILEKIHQKGIDSLTKKERETLDNQ
jgi:membrane associated rhomboid family serine protease